MVKVRKTGNLVIPLVDTVSTIQHVLFLVLIYVFACLTSLGWKTPEETDSDRLWALKFIKHLRFFNSKIGTKMRHAACHMLYNFWNFEPILSYISTCSYHGSSVVFDFIILMYWTDGFTLENRRIWILLLDLSWNFSYSINSNASCIKIAKRSPSGFRYLIWKQNMRKIS